MRTTHWNVLLFVTSAVVFAVVCFGCDVPENAPSQCVERPGDTYRYACQDGTERCLTTTGDVKYAGCFMADGVYCVESCR